jgi:type I restriction enzyme M protein
VTSPGAPAGNPKLIILDTSVLLQAIATDQLVIFRRIRTDFGIQAAIAQAVESETLYHLENTAKFRGRQEQLKKALGNSTLASVDHNLLAPLLGSGADSWLRQIESEGERLYSIVDRGEAFSHASSQDRADEAAMGGKKYTHILDKPYRWQEWAAPRDKDGRIDHNRAKTGDDLRDFVNQKLFPYLHGFKQKATGPNTIEYKMGEIFGEIKNKISSGYNLREIIDHIDELRFRSQTEKHELSHLYEAKIRNMGNAGRNGGEYYTPRPLIRAMVQVVQPKIGERVYDGAVGSAGFLCESFDFMKAKPGLTTREFSTLQTRTFTGKEKKSLAYVIAIMNMILHGIEAPNIIHTNTLTENLADIQEKDRFDVVLANPPFGGKERKEVQQNFPIRTGETAFLFLQNFIKILKAGGRGGVVIKNTFLSNTDNASVSLRKLLLESCNLHTVLDCPGGTFQGAGVKTVVLFFEKGTKTRKVWYYQLDPGRNLGKTNPLNDADLAEFVKLQKTHADSPKSWSVDAKTIDPATFDLSVKNPNGGEEVTHRSPQEIMDEIAALDAESAEVLETIRGLL